MGCCAAPCNYCDISCFNIYKHPSLSGRCSSLVRLAENTITVADDGMQIDGELAEHIFEPFSRGDKARSTGGGSGLGLSIASKIVEMHGGELKLDRNYGHGYTKAFHITLD